MMRLKRHNTENLFYQPRQNNLQALDLDTGEYLRLRGDFIVVY